MDRPYSVLNPEALEIAVGVRDPLFPPLIDVDGIMLANFEFMKVLPAFDQVQKGLLDGRLRPGDLIVESTSGNFGVGLSRAWSARAGLDGQAYPLILVTVPGGFPAPLDSQLAALGVQVEVITERINGSFQIPRLRRLAQIIERESQRLGKMPFWPEQYDNPDIKSAYVPFAHKVSSYAQRFYGRAPDIFVNAIGTGASAEGVTQVLRQYNPELICACVDPQGSAILGKDPLPNTTTRGSGGATKCRNTNYALIDHAHWIDRDQAVFQMQHLHARGVSIGFSAGGAFHVARWYKRQFPDKVVFVLGADKVDRYLTELMSPQAQLKHDIIPQDLAEPEVISAPNVFTKPAHGWGWQMLPLTTEWRDILSAKARHDFQERRAVMAEYCPSIASRP